MATKRVSDVQSSAEMASEKKQKQVRVWVDGWWVWLHWIEQSICFFFSDYTFARFLKMIVQLPCTLLSYSIMKKLFLKLYFCAIQNVKSMMKIDFLQWSLICFDASLLFELNVLRI